MNLALFDFDGTITTGDTFVPLLRFAVKPHRVALGTFLTARYDQIGTTLEAEHGVQTGRYRGADCSGPPKGERIHARWVETG